MKKNALATCCDSVLVSTRLFLRGCALALAWFWVFPFLCWVDPGLVAHTVLVASRCCCLWVSARGRVTRKFSCGTQTSNKHQTQMWNLLYPYWVGKAHRYCEATYGKVEGSRFESRTNFVKILRTYFSEISSFEISGMENNYWKNGNFILCYVPSQVVDQNGLETKSVLQDRLSPGALVHPMEGAELEQAMWRVLVKSGLDAKKLSVFGADESSLIARQICEQLGVIVSRGMRIWF